MASRILFNTVGFCARSNPAVRTVLSFIALNSPSPAGRRQTCETLVTVGDSKPATIKPALALLGIAVTKKRRPFGQLDTRFAMQLDGAQHNAKANGFFGFAHTENAKRAAAAENPMRFDQRFFRLAKMENAEVHRGGIEQTIAQRQMLGVAFAKIDTRMQRCACATMPAEKSTPSTVAPRLAAAAAT